MWVLSVQNAEENAIGLCLRGGAPFSPDESVCVSMCMGCCRGVCVHYMSVHVEVCMCIHTCMCVGVLNVNVYLWGCL